MKSSILCLSLAGAFAAGVNAADITWQTPGTISGASEVSTAGAYFGSWAPQDGGANTMPVNGVTFQGFSDLPGLTPGATWDNGYNGYASPGTPDSNYNSLLQYARFSNENTTPATFSWSGMTPGNTYLVQFWVNDGRSIGQLRYETLSGGTDTSPNVYFGSNADGSGPGQYIIGTFVADNTGSETLTVTPYSMGSSPDPQINLLQVRDLTPVPEPSALAVSAVGLALGLGLRRKHPPIEKARS